MKKRFVVVSLLVLVALLSAFVGSAAASASTVCYLINSHATNNTATGTLIADIRFINMSTHAVLFEQVYHIPAGTQNNIQGHVHADSGIAVTFDNHISYDPPGTSPQNWSVNSDSSLVAEDNCLDGFGKITDGRINALDLAAPLAAYCADQGIAVWDIDDSGHGTLGFTAPLTDIQKALSDAQSSGQNILVAQGLGDSLYALTSNSLMLVGPDIKEPSKTYQFVTTPDVCGGA